MINRFIQMIKTYFSFSSERSLTFFLYTAIAIVMYVSLLPAVLPEKLDLSLYSMADRDIASPVTIENKQATVAKQNEAAEAVDTEYTYREETAQNQTDKVQELFSSVKAINRGDFTEEDDPELTISEKVEVLNENLSSSTSAELSDETLQAFLTASPSQLDIAKDVAITTVRETLNARVTVDTLNDAKNEAVEKVENTNLRDPLKSALKELVQFAVVPNYFIDTEATNLKRQQAMEAVQPVMIHQGDILVQEGEVINREVLEQLELVGLLDDRFNPFPYFGLALLVIVLLGLLYYFLQDTDDAVRSHRRHLLLYLTIFFLTVLLLKIVSLFLSFSEGIGFIAPVAMGTMLIKMLINERIAIASALVFAVMGSIIFNTEIAGIFHAEYGIYMLFSSLAAIFYLGKHNLRSKILKAGLFVSSVNVVVIAIFYMLKRGQIEWIELGINGGSAFIGGFLSAVLTLGFMPFFEAVFGILSTMKLIELSNPNHPLLRKILTEAPGTYHHSVMVANLADAACESIGANGLLARVGSYYHDVGKTKRPNFFIENQMNMENPHDKIAPQLSKTIIVAHPYDGADMLRKHHLPKEIIDIAEQHHGTMLLKFFYHKASAASAKEIPETDFRYPGPKAQTKEAAIVGICDGVEAAVRSMAKPNPNKIQALVRKIINERLEDGQFDESDLTLKELDTVAKTICETLQGIFHSRIEYPEELKKKKVN